MAKTPTSSRGKSRKKPRNQLVTPFLGTHSKIELGVEELLEEAGVSPADLTEQDYAAIAESAMRPDPSTPRPESPPEIPKSPPQLESLLVKIGKGIADLKATMPEPGSTDKRAGEDCPVPDAPSETPRPVVHMDRAFDILTIPGHRRLCAEIYGDTYEHMNRLIARGRDPRWVYLHIALAVAVVLWTITVDYWSKLRHGDQKRSPGSD